MDDIEAKIIENRNIVLNYFLMRLRLSKPMGSIIPGQFAMIKVPDSDVFLRRPFSVYDSGKDTISIMYRTVGKGTDALSKAVKNEAIRVLAPLGKGFHINQRDKHIIITGGIGIAGVHLLVKMLKDKARIFYGCSTKEELKVVDDILRFNPSISTLNGSAGFRGDVVSLFKSRMDAFRGKDIEIYTCGPEGMTRSLRKTIDKTRTPCQVLVEERMACGLGLCFGCAVKTVDENEPYKRACKEGPVFDLWQIYQ